MIKFKNFLLSASALLVLAACGTTTDEEAPTTEDPAVEEEVNDDAAGKTSEESVLEEFTAAELSEYDGQDGNPGYVAVDGVVYDVTGNEAWAGGEHAGELVAGNDYTEEILESPHGESVLEDLPVVGNLVE